MEIRRTVPADMDIMRMLWNRAIQFQKEGGYPVWPEFPEGIIYKDMDQGLNFKLSSGDRILCYFSISMNDRAIWGDRDRDDAIYIHRGVTAPEFRGLGLTRFVFEWARVKAKLLGRKFIRIDTWGSNKHLIDYYIRAGFKLTGYRQMGEEPGLMEHYSNLYLALFETGVD